MNKRYLLFSSIALATLLWIVPVSRADSLDVTLTQSSQTVTLGTSTVAFDATISNPSAADTIFLNSDSSTTSSLFLTVDDTPFFNNAPLSLDPGANSGPIELFDVLLAPNTPTGVYDLNLFSILGGPDAGSFSDFSDLVDVAFSIDVVSPVATPEPSSLLLVFAGLVGVAAFLGARKRLASNA